VPAADFHTFFCAACTQFLDKHCYNNERASKLKTEFPKAAEYIRERLVELTTTVMVRRFVCPAPLTDDGAKEDRDDAQAPGSCHRSHCPRPRASGARAVYPYYPTHTIPRGTIPSSVAASPGGNIWLTGHDADFHCNDGDPQCHYVKTAVDFVMNGSRLPLLVLDPCPAEPACGGQTSEVEGALIAAYAPSPPPGACGR
jgi:hypothetical protein